jgi:hypothetical protein
MRDSKSPKTLRVYLFRYGEYLLGRNVCVARDDSKDDSSLVSDVAVHDPPY